MSLEDVVQGAVVRSGSGCFLLIERPLGDLIPGGAAAFRDRYVRMISGAHWDGLLRDPQPGSLGEIGPEDILYVDVETTGLSAGTPLFLVGALVLKGGDLTVLQLLARDYTEEAPLLDYFSGTLGEAGLVISFNGKSYDLPYIRDRSAFHRIPFCLDQPHFDLLHEARRRWRERLPNCRLQTLERAICGRIRTDDIPGADIPDAYHRFVQTQNASQMRDILHHNALDLITMAQMVVFMLEGRDL